MYTSFDLTFIFDQQIKDKIQLSSVAVPPCEVVLCRLHLFLFFNYHVFQSYVGVDAFFHSFLQGLLLPRGLALKHKKQLRCICTENAVLFSHDVRKHIPSTFYTLSNLLI